MPWIPNYKGVARNREKNFHSLNEAPRVPQAETWKKWYNTQKLKVGFKIKKSRSGRMKQRGINLIEVAITIAIIAILLAISIPLFNNYIDGKKLDTALRQVEADLRKAQSLAKSSGKPYTVDFTQNSSAYQIHNSSSVSASLENGVVSKNTVSVTFNPAYSTSEITSSSTVTIVLKSPRGSEGSVLVNPAGKITISP